MPDKLLPRPQQFLAAMQARGLALRAGEMPPKSLAEWETRRAEIRKRLIASLGGFPSDHADLAPEMHGELLRDGYRVLKLTLQTRPSIRLTANLYLPDAPGRHPAVLCVHGHWKGAKQDPVVQSRCLGLVKLGFVVLVVDAFGAGERARGKALGEYHGEMTGAILFPTGLTLAGLQVYDNMRCVDYLQSRPEVNGEKLGITGASGGGNQTMYAGALDDRFSAVVPVCSVGTYQAYLGAACCMCEAIPDALTYTSEAGVLALVAPRALMVVNATRDAFQFSVGEAEKSIAAARAVFELHNVSANLKHAIFESPHDYNRAMREAMYGWMTRHLKGEASADPIPEPEFKTEDPEDLRCYPGESRPDSFITLPAFAAQVARELVDRANREPLAHREHWDAIGQRRKSMLEKRVLGGFPPRFAPVVHVDAVAEARRDLWTLLVEPDLELTAIRQRAEGQTRGLAVVVDFRGAEAALDSELAQALLAAGHDVLALEPRASGRGAVAGDTIGLAPDHNSAEWSLWTGRPLLGQWAWDIRQLVDALAEREPRLLAGAPFIGLGTGALPLATAAIFDRRIERVVLVGPLATYVTAAPCVGQRLGLMAPRILRDVGDVPHLLSLLAPRPLLLAGAVRPTGEPLTGKNLADAFEPLRAVYGVLEALPQLQFRDPDPAAITTWITS